MLETPTVFVVDDEEVVRDSVCWLLESIKLRVETYDSAEAFLKQYSIYQVGCLLLDIRMPGMSGLQLQQKLNENKYPIPIIIITGHGDVALAVRAMKHGAMDFIQKPYNDQDLLDSVKLGLERDIDNQRRRLHYDSVQARLNNLTPRETEVMERVVKQQLNKVIAAELHVGIKTIEFHRAKIMEKMHAKTLLDLVSMLSEIR